MKLTEKTTLSFVVLAIVIAVSVLFGLGQREFSAAQKNVWGVSFADFSGNDADFVINNQSESQVFHWTMLKDKGEIDSGSMSVATHATERIAPNLLGDGKRISGKVLVRVTGEDGFTREIYKVLSK